jgi:hypothetical protein
VGLKAGLDAVKRKDLFLARVGDWIPVVRPVTKSLYWLGYSDSLLSTVQT